MKYVVEVANLFLDRCPEKTILSPMDFVTIAEWEKQEIPFEVILKAVDEYCGQGTEVTSASDLHLLVKRTYGEWLADG